MAKLSQNSTLVRSGSVTLSASASMRLNTLHVGLRQNISAFGAVVILLLQAFFSQMMEPHVQCTYRMLNCQALQARRQVVQRSCTRSRLSLAL